jgi:hypothetical protein
MTQRVVRYHAVTIRAVHRGIGYASERHKTKEKGRP